MKERRSEKRFTKFYKCTTKLPYKIDYAFPMRDERVEVRMSSVELRALDRARGKAERSEYLRGLIAADAIGRKVMDAAEWPSSVKVEHIQVLDPKTRTWLPGEWVGNALVLLFAKIVGQQNLYTFITALVDGLTATTGGAQKAATPKQAAPAKLNSMEGEGRADPNPNAAPGQTAGGANDSNPLASLLDNGRRKK
jgi:hypothetical protein